MRNPAAHAALKRFCQDALAHMREAVPKDGQPAVYWRWVYRFSDTGRTGAQEETVDWPQVVREYLGDPNSIPSWSAALAEFQADPKLSGSHLTVEQPPLTIKGFPVRLVSQQESLAFDSQVFDALYQETEDYFYQDAVTYRYLAPLRRFSMQAEEIPLDRSLSIVRVPDAWRQEMLDATEGAPQVAAELHEAASRAYGLVLYLDLQKEQGQELPRRMQGQQEDAIKHVRNEFRLVCSALRLFKAGAVGYEQIVPRPTSWVPWSSFAVHRGGPASSIGETYALTHQEADQFLGFWSCYCRSIATAQKHVALAISRFATGYARASPGERLIDFMVAFEALLLESEPALSYKLAMRVAALLGQNPHDRETLYHELLAAYKERNHIVHGTGPPHPTVEVGNKEPKEKVKLEDFNGRVEGHLRAAIKAVMQPTAKQNKQDMIRDLDLQIARGMTSP